MKKLMFIFGLIFLLSLINEVCAVRINEVELNPVGKDSGNEWIELYSDEEIDLSSWKLINNDNDSIELNQVFQGYLVINFDTQWLDNEDEKVFLYYDLELIDDTLLFSDSDDDDKTWSYCDGDWVFVSSTKDLVNFCGEDKEERNLNISKEINEAKENSSMENEIIQLGKMESPKTENIKTNENIIYKSKSELIKKYSVFGFALLCVVLSILLVLNKLN